MISLCWRWGRHLRKDAHVCVGAQSLPAETWGPGTAPALERRSVGLCRAELTAGWAAASSDFCARQCLKNRINTSNDVSCKFSMSREIAQGPSFHICCYNSQTTWPQNLFWSLIRQNPCDLWGWASRFWKEIIRFTRRKALAHCSWGLWSPWESCTLCTACWKSGNVLICPSHLCAINIQRSCFRAITHAMFPSVYTKADAIQHPDDPECCFHPVLGLLYYFFHVFCAEVYLSPQLCCPKNKAGPPQTKHSEAAQDARSPLLLIFCSPI